MKVKNLKMMLLLVAVTVVFVGCSKDDEPANPNSSIIGTWFWSGADYDWDDGYKELTYHFHSNGTIDFTVYYYPDDETYECSDTYVISGNKITFAFIGCEYSYIGDTFEIGKDSKGDYLIFYYNEAGKENALLKGKFRRKK